MRSSMLIVDDEAQSRRLMRSALEPLGCAVREAAHGEEALERVRESKPDLILLDVLMPRMDGYETCRQLKQDPVTRLVPVVMLTSLHELPDRLKAIELGVDDFLVKPCNISELVTRVPQALHGRAGERRKRAREHGRGRRGPRRVRGRRYPDGLRGNAIPMTVRIISVVDVYDALATRRPYKEPLPRERCLAILNEDARKGWRDADVVHALEEALATVSEVRP